MIVPCTSTSSSPVYNILYVTSSFFIIVSFSILESVTCNFPWCFRLCSSEILLLSLVSIVYFVLGQMHVLQILSLAPYPSFKLPDILLVLFIWLLTSELMSWFAVLSTPNVMICFMDYSCIFMWWYKTSREVCSSFCIFVYDYCFFCITEQLYFVRRESSIASSHLNFVYWDSRSIEIENHLAIL